MFWILLLINIFVFLIIRLFARVHQPYDKSENIPIMLLLVGILLLSGGAGIYLILKH
jgi:hypothetical protein